MYGTLGILQGLMSQGQNLCPSQNIKYIHTNLTDDFSFEISKEYFFWEHEISQYGRMKGLQNAFIYETKVVVTTFNNGWTIIMSQSFHDNSVGLNKQHRVLLIFNNYM